MGTAQMQGPLWAPAPRLGRVDRAAPDPVLRGRARCTGRREGTRLFDAGCGSGLALVLAHRRGAIVTGLDASAGLLEIARARLPEADLREGDLEELPYADDSFDAVTAFNPCSTRATRPAPCARSSASPSPAHRVAVTTWGTAEQCEMRAVLGAIGELLPPPPPGAGGPFALAASGRARGPRRRRGADTRAHDRRPGPVRPRRRRDRGARAPRLRARAARDRHRRTRCHARRPRSGLRGGPPRRRVGALRQRVQGRRRARVSAATPPRPCSRRDARRR